MYPGRPLSTSIGSSPSSMYMREGFWFGLQPYFNASSFIYVYVLVSFNSSKNYIFDTIERVELVRKCVKNLDNVEVSTFDGTVVEFARQVNSKVILRGLRNPNDYQNELEIYNFNNSIDSSIETILMFADKQNLFISSTVIKELVNYDCNLSKFVPLEIIEDVYRKIKYGKKKEYI